MKKNKILAGLSALVMGATMMAGTAMSASAYCIHDGNDNCVEDVGFYAYYGGGWSPAPYGMYDHNIADAVNNGDGTYTLDLQTGTFTIPYVGDISGSISFIGESQNGTNLIVNDEVTLTENVTYQLYVPQHNMWYSVQLRSESCSCSDCGCNDYLNP